MKFYSLALIFLGILVMVGCGTTKPADQVVTKENLPKMVHDAITQTDWVAEVKQKAKDRHLYYEISCADWNKEGDHCAYIGQASEFAPKYWRYYKDEGGKPKWFVCGESQQIAAFKLTAALNGPPDEAHDRETEKPKRQCVAPIKGGPQQ